MTDRELLVVLLDEVNRLKSQLQKYELAIELLVDDRHSEAFKTLKGEA